MMKNYLSLLGIQMREVVWVAWVFPAIGLVMYGLPFLTVSRTHSGLSMVLSIMPSVYTVMLAYLLVIKDRTTWAKEFRLMAHAEFLISRPILRRTGYAAFMTIYFVMILFPSVANLAYACQNPSLEFLCYQSAGSKTEAAVYRDLYLQILPDSQLVERPKSSPIILWPKGAVFVAGWKLLIVVVLAVMIQFVVFLRLPKIAKTILAAAIIVAPPLLLLLSMSVQSAFQVYQNLFGFFINHWVVVVSSGIVIVLALEVLAFRLSAESEIT